MGCCLIIDDSRVARKALRRALVAADVFGEIQEAADGEEALALLAGDLAERLDLVLCDLLMPGIDGFELLARLQADPRLADVPVIVLTGEEDIETKVQALESGASDYLTKPFADAELLARVKVHRNLKLLREELRDANGRLSELATRDPLTGVFNRRHFEVLLATELDRARRHDHSVALILADLDHFKSINDRFGHVAGDRVLTAVANTLLDGVRGHDVVGRYGGEEFVIFLPETDLDEALVVSERLRGAIAALSFDDYAGLEVRTSLGVAEANGVSAADGDPLVSAADDALYRAKRAGRDQVMAAEPVVQPAT